MAKKSSQELAQDVIAGRNTGINMNSTIAKEIVANRGASLAQKEARSFGFAAPTKLVDYTVPMSAVYDRLSDGSYVAKYENYLGATGNEDRLAKQQSASEQIGNGLLKNGIKSVNYFADSLIGTAYGIAKGVTSGDFTDLYDNEVTNFFDDTNKTLDNTLHNYYTDEQKSMGLIKSLGTANFWANDVAGGLAFVGGAVLSNALVGALTGGATLGTSAARLTMKTLGKSAVNEAGEKAAKAALKNFTKAKNAKLLGDQVGTGLFLARTSNFEAGMEARQNLKDATDKFYSDYEQKNGKSPSYEESKDFINSATKAANGVYAANMAILSVSNAVMFGKKILPSSFTDKLTGFGERIVGLGVDKTVVDGVVTQTMKKANKLQKIAGRTSNLLGKPLTEGLYEEGFQGVAGKTMQNYLDAKYSDENIQGISLASAMYDGFAEQYGTSEGWKEMGVGMIIGFAGGAVQPGGKLKDKIPGFGANSWSEQRKAKELSLERSNKGLETLANLNRTSAVAGMTTRAQAEDGGKFSTLIDTVEDYNYIKSQEGIKENSEILEDYNTTIDSMDFSNNKEILSMLQESGMEVEQYKATLKDNFKSTLDDYTFAKKAVAALGLSERMKDEKGNIIEVAEAQTFNIMAGKNALRNAQEIGKQLDKVIGTDGIFDYYQHYNNLSEDKKQQADSLLEKQKELKELQDIALTLSQESNRIAQIPGDNLDVESKRKSVSEQAVTTQNRIASLAQEIDVLTKALDTDLTAAQFDLTGKLTEMPKIGVMNAVQEIEKIDLYTQSLRSMGRNKEAQKIEQVVKEFKTFSFAHKEMIDFHNKMLDSNFFSTKEGKSFTQKLLGKKYEISDDFKELVEKNSDIIDRSLELNGLKQYGEFKDQWKAISENPEISDREKYRMESLIRMNLATWAIQNIAEELRDAKRDMNISTTVEQGPIKKGDTILTKTEVAGKDLNNLEVLNKLIKEITDQLDYVVNYNTKAQAEVNQLKSQLNDLELRKTELEKLLEEKTVQPEEVISDTEQAAPVNNNREELDKINQDIETIQKKIDEIYKDYRILESEEYKRFETLSKKKEKGTINNQEEVELESLRESIDRWTFITGVVVDGFRLSDLIMQKVVLENTPIGGTNQVVVPTSEDTLSDVDFDDISGKANYSYLQVYDNVVVAQDGDNIVLHHINMEDFIALVGEDIIEEYEIPFVLDASGKGNLQIRVQDVENINKSENVRIVPPKANVGRVGALLTRTTTMASSPELKPTESKFNNQMNYGLGHNPTAVYASKVGDELNIVVDLTNPYNKEYIDELGAAYRLVKNKENPTKKDLERLEAAKTAVIENLSLLAMNGEDAVGTLKGIRNVTKDDKNDHVFEALRVAMMDNNQLIEELIKDGAAGLVNLSLEDNEGNMVSPKIKVQKVLPGIPNYNYIENENGEIVVENRPLIESQIEKIVSIGYMENGTVKTQDNIGADTTFLQSLQKRSKEDKIPFIVLSVGGKRIAYPVKVNTISQEYEADFRALYEAKGLDDTTKAANLNRYLASKGIDIKVSGNAFVSFGETNLNDTFFNEKLAQLNNINYFYSVEEWLNPETSMKDVLSNQVTVDVDVNNPFHSPKIQMDFSDLNLKRASDIAQQKAQNTAKTKAKKAKDINATNVTSVLFGKECK